MSQDYEIRLYQDGDEREIVNLMNLVYDGWPKKSLSVSSLDHWRWKYLADPLALKQTAVAVGKRGEIIGCQHSLPINMKIGPRIVKSSLAPDLVVHPDFRRLGISNGLIDMLNSLRPKYGFEFVYFDTGNPILIKRNKKKYSTFAHPLKHLVKIRDMDLHLRNVPTERAMMKKYGYYLLRHSKRVMGTLRGRRGSRPRELQIVDSPRFDEKMNAFWEDVKGQYDFITERRTGYLNWRYCDPRGGDYTVRTAVDGGGGVLGYAALRINRYRRDYPTGFIVDLLALPGALDAAEALVEDAMNMFEESQVNIVNCLMVSRHPYERILDGKGLLSTGRNFNSFYDIYSGDKKEIEGFLNSHPSRIHYMYGNSDTI